MLDDAQRDLLRETGPAALAGLCEQLALHASSPVVSPSHLAAAIGTAQLRVEALQACGFHASREERLWCLFIGTARLLHPPSSLNYREIRNIKSGLLELLELARAEMDENGIPIAGGCASP